MSNYFKNIRDKFIELPILADILAWSKKAVFPGFSGVPIYYIIRFIYSELLKDNLTTRANAIAFSFLISIFPAIIFFFTLIPHLPGAVDFSDDLIATLQRLLPHTAANYLISIIDDITGIRRQGLLSIGFILAIYFSSRGMLTLMAGFDKGHKLTYMDRGFFKKQWLALLLTIVLASLVIFSFVLVILGSKIIEYLKELFKIEADIVWAINIFRWLAAIMFIYIGITIIYRYAPSMRKKLAFINPGSVVATLLSLFTSVIFAYFVNNFGKYNEIYGSIGALIVIMIWLQYNAFVLLVGFELNSSIAVNSDMMMADKSDKPKHKKSPL